MDSVFDACLALGYSNLTRDNLRVVDDWNSNNLYILPDTLPILIMPYADNTPHARHAVPTWNGDACMFRLQDAYAASGSASTFASLRAVNMSVRYNHTMEWLKRPGGSWKNGWYEDLEGIRWYADLTSSAPGAPYFMMFRLFDMRSGKERDCSNPSDCEAAGKLSRWGDKFIASDKSHRFSSVYIANGTEFGIFIFESDEIHTVRIVSDWETLLSNLSVALVLVRWIMGLVSLHSGAIRGKSQWFSGGGWMRLGSRGLCALANNVTTTSEDDVSCLLDGRLQFPGTTIWASRSMVCHLSGNRSLRAHIFQPVEYTSQVRAPSNIRCFIHPDIDGRISTVVYSDEVDKMTLVDYFTTDLAWRMNGRIALIFWMKVSILAINLLPLLVAHSFPISVRHTDLGLHGVERALALRARHVGGLGQSLTYIAVAVDRNRRRVSAQILVASVKTLSDPKLLEGNESIQQEFVHNSTSVTPNIPFSGQKNINNNNEFHEIALVNSYELIRLRYLEVAGNSVVASFRM
ncbi:unnamed protein product [Phytophthora fragariaefolia]|uniref:Unnamed protein product n=1 Tax=Phytophthora fragariaefolia TaxID=1490495 RepID=A0A9W7CY79_9STRA|nr:unnamed protein product [Phytophthora fragariaefolia]